MTPLRDWRCWLALLLGALAAMLWPMSAQAQDVPRAALRYRSILIRAARAEWGLSAPVASMAAQVHQESGWDAAAKSWAGAEGLAQFMPSTAQWLPSVAPQTGEPMPYNPGWALRALAAYDRWLWERVDARTACDRMAMAMASYNGGLGWLRRDVRLARSLGLAADRWWGGVETVNAGRAPAAWKENRGYPRRILLLLESLYTAWGAGVCQ